MFPGPIQHKKTCEPKQKNLWKFCICRWVTVEGLPYREVRHLSDALHDQPEDKDQEDQVVEFSLPSWEVSRVLWSVPNIRTTSTL